MLLHMIEAAGPVDHAGDAHAGVEPAIEDVRDLIVVLIDDVEHTRRAECARVEGLSSRRRIKRRLIEYDVQLVADGVARRHARLERRPVRLLIVESLRRHWCADAAATRATGSSKKKMAPPAGAGR